MTTYKTVHAGARSLIQRIGRRGSFLLWLALLDLIYAFGLSHPTTRSAANPTALYLERWLPLDVWAILWGSVGLICLFYAFREKDAVAYGAAVALKAGWAVTFLLGWLVGEVERGYLTAAIWAAFAAVILIVSGWRENSYLDKATMPVAYPKVAGE